MLKLVTFPGLAAIIVSFLLGFLIKDIAISKAQNDAIAQTTDEVFELIKNTESARLNLSDLEASNERISSSVTLVGSGLEEVKQRSDNLRQTVTQADTELRNLLGEPEKTIAALKLLDQFDEEFDIAARLANSSRVKYFHWDLTLKDFKTQSVGDSEKPKRYRWSTQLIVDGKQIQGEHTFMRARIVGAPARGFGIGSSTGGGSVGIDSAILTSKDKVAIDAVVLMPAE